jgi:hypothetical protein
VCPQVPERCTRLQRLGILQTAAADPAPLKDISLSGIRKARLATHTAHAGLGKVPAG